MARGTGWRPDKRAFGMISFEAPKLSTSSIVLDQPLSLDHRQARDDLVLAHFLASAYTLGRAAQRLATLQLDDPARLVPAGLAEADGQRAFGQPRRPGA